MIVAVGLLGGFALGWTRAKRRGGNRADQVQYAIAHAIALGLLAFVIATVLANLAG